MEIKGFDAKIIKLIICDEAAVFAIFHEKTSGKQQKSHLKTDKPK